MTLASTFSNNLQLAIRRSGKSKASVARKAGYSPSYLDRIINGERPNPSLYFVECMAQAVGVDPLSLLKD